MAIKEISLENIGNTLKKFEDDGRWFDDNYKKLQQKYSGNLVLVRDKQVVAYAPTMELLKESARKKDVDISQHFVEFVDESSARFKIRIY